jgi:ribosome-interacting GTPase 1
MAANLTPQYLKAEEEYRRAQNTADELRWLEVMYREIPKHKASEKLQSELKQKISRAKKELEVERKAPKAGHGVRIPRQGAGTAVLIGGPNSGKSQLLASLTRAQPEIAPYPFTTRQPLAGMMPWEDVMVQLIDTPPITRDFMEPYLQGVVRAADIVVLLVDLGSDDGIEQLQEVLDRLNETKTRLGRESRLDDDDIGLSYTQTLLVPNKIDLPEAGERLGLLKELCPLDFAEYVISAAAGRGLAELKNAIYQALGVIRVYTKLPTHKEADFNRPFTLRRGGTVQDVAELVHEDVAAHLKHARLWGTGVFDGTVVKADHVLNDRDIVELHA